MHFYVLGHGSYDAGAPWVQLPPNHADTIRFYAAADTWGLATVTSGMMYRDALGARIDVAESSGSVPNYIFRRDDPASVAWAFAQIQDPGSLLVVGGEHLRDGIRLCEGNGGQCGMGYHDCDGILGLYLGHSLDFLNCRAPRGGGTPDPAHLTERDELGIGEMYDVCTGMLARDTENGLPFSGELAAFWESLPQGTQASLRFHSDLHAWFEERAAWSASHGFTDGGALAAYAHSLYSERDIDAMEVLLRSPYVVAALPRDHLCQLSMLHLLAKSPHRFEDAYFDLSEEEREYVQQHPVLYEQVMIMLGI